MPNICWWSFRRKSRTYRLSTRIVAIKATKKPIYETNPVATAALQAALDSAQDGDAKYSKVYIDAKVDERIELNVKPAAKKLKTEL